MNASLVVILANLLMKHFKESLQKTKKGGIRKTTEVEGRCFGL